MGSQQTPSDRASWPPSLDVLEGLCGEGLLRRTFLRLSPERRLAVLNAAIDEAAEQGPGQINIKSVAARAGVPVGSLYQYFGGREQLIRLTCVLVSKHLETVLGIAGPILTELPLRQGLREYLTRSIDWCKSEPSLLRIYVASGYTVALRRELNESGDDPDQSIVDAIARTVQQVTRSFLLAACHRGELRADLDVEDACRILNVLLISIIDAALLPGLNAYYRLFDSKRGPKRLIEAAVDFACRGILRS